jgi:hypothetical protein
MTKSIKIPDKDGIETIPPVSSGAAIGQAHIPKATIPSSAVERTRSLRGQDNPGKRLSTTNRPAKAAIIFNTISIGVNQI